ncbi:hypothetical protein [Natrinema caseinilyticum]|uniref:hypothetical protein n=1 Tax=Natrinema caseinilyticum TaxID=2961570 RepID=UPI0020C331DE|nr:hypothetical protein [Natrinema caseinilyticum]
MTDSSQFTRICLEEVLREVETLDTQLSEPITLRPAITTLETTVELLERVVSNCAGGQKRTR